MAKKSIAQTTFENFMLLESTKAQISERGFVTPKSVANLCSSGQTYNKVVALLEEQGISVKKTDAQERVAEFNQEVKMLHCWSAEEVNEYIKNLAKPDALFWEMRKLYKEGKWSNKITFPRVAKDSMAGWVFA